MTNRVRVADLAQQVRGVTYRKEDASKQPLPGYVPVLRAGNITDSGLTLDDLVFVPAAKVSPRQKLRRNDVLIAASSGSLDVVGKAARAADDLEAGFGAFCKVLRPGPQIEPRYFAHFFKTPAYRRTISSLAEGANINNLKSEHLDELKIPLPSVAEQRRIAAVLDQADALRATRREAIAQLDELTQSIFLDMFGDPVANTKSWPRADFGGLLDSIDSGRSPNCHDRAASSGEWGVLKLGAVTRCKYDWSQNKALPDGVEPDPRHEVQQGDVLFSRKNTRELVAACAYVRSTPPRMLLPDLIFRLKLKSSSGIDPVYLQSLLTHPRKRRKIQGLAGGSAGSMPNISKTKLQTVVIERPPLPLQQEFARRVEAIERLKRSHRAHLAELDALFASLQTRAFRGEL